MTETYKPDHSTFGGIIYDYDFDGYLSMSDIAKRIEQDKKLDKLCRKNANKRKANVEYRKCNKCRKDLFK